MVKFNYNLDCLLSAIFGKFLKIILRRQNIMKEKVQKMVNRLRANQTINSGNYDKQNQKAERRIAKIEKLRQETSAVLVKSRRKRC